MHAQVPNTGYHDAHNGKGSVGFTCVQMLFPQEIDQKDQVWSS